MLTAHESCELNELLASCTNSINSMGFFINTVQCKELKSILKKHMEAHIQDYNMKVEWASNGRSNQTLQVPPMPETQLTLNTLTTLPCTPNPSASSLDDRAIATSYLLTLKRAGREYAWSAFETTDSNLRQFLEDAFTMCSRHALEVGHYMVKNGYYPIDDASNLYLQKLAATYQPVQASYVQ